MQNILQSPPVAFVIVLAAVLLFTYVLSRFAFKRTRTTEDICKAYACGEDIRHHYVQPDYTQFFPFAFFFTILHVITLFLTTVPKITMDSFVITILYLGGAITALIIFLRK